MSAKQTSLTVLHLRGLKNLKLPHRKNAEFSDQTEWISFTIKGRCLSDLNNSVCRSKCEVSY
jgi:hypothetical protein